MSDIIEVIKDVTTVTIASDGPQGPQGPQGAAGPSGLSGVISVVAPITNTGTSTSAIIGINAGVANGVATLDSGGKVPQSQIPAVAITNTFVVASQAAMLALTAEEGDVAVRTDQNKTYILTATPSSTLANWQELLTPTDTVTSVDGRIGTVTLTDKYAQLATANTFTGGVQQITTASAATKGLILKATASQTANLQEWQDSAGTVVGSVSAAGLPSFSAGSNTYGTFTGSANAAFVGVTGDTIAFAANRNFATGTFTSTSKATAFIYLTAAASDGFISMWTSATNNSAGSEKVRITSGGLLLVNSTSSTLGGGGIPSQVGIVTALATTVGLVVRAAASPSANLQEWQNSAGTVLAMVNSVGTLRVPTLSNPAANGPYFEMQSTFINIQTRSATNVGLIISGAASQSGNLTVWQNSSGTILTNVNASGTINFQTGNTSATATAGAVTAPALVVGFITMQVAGTTVKVPYYAN